MKSIFVIFVVLAIAAWLTMAISALRMLRHRRRSIMWLATNGWAFLWGDAFAPDAEKYRRRVLLAAAVFIMAIALAAGAAALGMRE